MESEKEASVRCAQLREDCEERSRTHPSGFTVNWLCFCCHELKLTTVIKYRELTLRGVILLHVA